MNQDDYDEEDEGNVGLAFGQGFFSRSEVAVNEDTAEIMSYLMPQSQICVQAFLVNDFHGAGDLGIEIIPSPKKGIAFIRVDQNLWDFIEDVAHCEHEAALYQGLILGELLVGTAHRMFFDQTGHWPAF
jgi:hypothetical protein